MKKLSKLHQNIKRGTQKVSEFIFVVVIDDAKSHFGNLPMFELSFSEEEKQIFGRPQKKVVESDPVGDDTTQKKFRLSLFSLYAQRKTILSQSRKRFFIRTKNKVAISFFLSFFLQKLLLVRESTQKFP